MEKAWMLARLWRSRAGRPGPTARTRLMGMVTEPRSGLRFVQRVLAGAE
jgi:hypothetical protein